MLTDHEVNQTFHDLMSLPAETEWVEFKEAKQNISFNDLGQYFSALSNEANLKRKHCGWLVLGVTDKTPRMIVGTNYRQDRLSLDKLKHEIAQQTNGLTFQEIYELQTGKGRVLLLHIPCAPAGIPVSWKGHFYGRNGESLSPLSIHELELIRGQLSDVDWSAEICAEASLDDLNDTAVGLAKQRFADKYANLSEDVSRWTVEQFLDKAKITRNGQLTRTAILLLGKPEAAHHVSPHPAQITWRLTADEEAYEHFGPPFLTTIEQIFQRIRNTRFRLQPFNQLVPVELTKYDSRTVLEAINNCIAHQDYSQNARIVVTECTDRIVLQNIGAFYDGSVEDYVLNERTPERYRNPFLTQAMVNLNMIDTMGMGIRRMFIEQRKRFFPLPEYEFPDANHVVMTIFGKLIDENYSRVLIEKQDLELAEVITLDRVQKKHPVDRKYILDLRKKGLIEGRYPNVYIAAQIAKATEQEADYTKHKAFDDRYYLDLMISFLEQHQEAKSSDFRRLLMDKLSDMLSPKQKKNKVRNLTQKLVQTGKIENVGKATRGAIWRLVRDKDSKI
ncbi:MAG: transcriptional regulator [Verrucomicrobiae bacterium]|nr:transcriptional regulator [Verrucomicrobiae bacterium]